MSYNKIEKQVIEKITPNKLYRERIYQIIEELRRKIEEEIQKRKLPASVELVGSMAKDTFLKDNLDIDFFLCYPTSYSKEKIARNTLDIGRKLLSDTEESYAEHPYLRGIFKGYKAEIVPCYQIEDASQKLSAVDRTPLHTKFIKENLDDDKKPDVRLFKQFLRGIGCYGAEAETEGFSGYLCEILILKYNTFQNLILRSQDWKYGEKLSVTKGKFPEFDTPLTFIDPVDSERNVSSALSKENFNLFVKASKEYIKKPTITFFFPNKTKPWAIDKIKKEIEKREFIGLKIEKPDIIAENLYPQVRKAVRSIKDLCKRYDFTILDARFYIDNDLIYIVLQPKKFIISKTLIHMGPPVKLKKNADEFIQKWKNNPRTIKKPFEKDKRLYVEIKREYTDIRHLLKEQVKNLSLGKHIDKIIKKDLNILETKELMTDNLRVFWTEYLDKKMPWER